MSDSLIRPNSWMLKVLRDLREKEYFCDAKIRLKNGVELCAHRTFLSMGSAYFYWLFLSDGMHKLKVENGSSVVSLDWIDEPLMRNALDYIYTNKWNLTEKNMFATFAVSDFLIMEEARKECLDLMLKCLNESNCLSIFDFTKQHMEFKTNETIKKYLILNFAHISGSNDSLLQMQLDDLLDILASDFLNIPDERFVWDFAIKWIDAKFQERLNYIGPLLQKLRLGLLENEFLRKEVEDHPYVISSEQCKPIIEEANDFRDQLYMLHALNDFIETPILAQPRISRDIILAIGGWSDGTGINSIESYDENADRWIKVGDEEEDAFRRHGVAYFGVAIISNKIYVIGGFDGREYFDSGRVFDIATKQWSSIAPMVRRRCYVSVAVLGGYLYAIGGNDGRFRLRTVERYDPSDDTWSSVAPMNCTRSDASATVLNGKIYVTGGYTGRSCLDSVEVFDPASPDGWQMVSSMNHRRSGVSCITYDDVIYVVGGYDGINRLKTVEKYDERTNEWVEIESMSIARSNFALTAMNGCLMVIGGYDGDSTVPQVECYDINLKQWFMCSDMNIHRSGLSACVIRDMPDLERYIYRDRKKLGEEKRLKVLALIRKYDDEISSTVNNIPVIDVNPAP